MLMCYHWSLGVGHIYSHLNIGVTACNPEYPRPQKMDNHNHNDADEFEEPTEEVTNPDSDTDSQPCEHSIFTNDSDSLGSNDDDDYRNDEDEGVCDQGRPNSPGGELDSDLDPEELEIEHHYGAMLDLDVISYD